VQVEHVGNQNVDIAELEAVLSKDKYAHEMEDFPIVEL
jgi:hypothetical protein